MTKPSKQHIPVTDIDSFVFDHPDVLNAAVVGVPDERLGERVCALLVVKDGRPELAVESFGEHFLDKGLAKHYLPERVACMPELPTTPSGKIQKFRLRTMIL